MTTTKLIEKYIPEFDYNQDNDVFGEDARNNNRETLKNFASELNNLWNIYEIAQFDLHFSDSSKVSFGYFHASSIDEVETIMKEGFEELYPGVTKDFYKNGNQWTTDKHEFGVMIQEIETNTFGEL